jgi:hypothetical protein
MATFTITDIKNIDELTGKTGGDVYNINGGTLTIDQHSRFGLNNNNSGATTATSMGNITISNTRGGTLNIDGRYVRMIPFNGGSGTIPALNSLVTQGAASGKLMCVYSSLTSAPVINGSAMPASGWIQIKQWNSVEYTSGAITLSGVTANATGASVVGFLEIFGDNASTLTAVRLGTVNITGEWYSLGTTNGVSNQTLQIPNNGTLKHIAGVYIEKNAGQKDYEFYGNAGTTTTTGTEAARGKVVWISNTGLVRIGNSGAATNGYTPPSGLEIVIPNIFLQCTTATARNAEVIPNAIVGTRYDFTTTGGGVLNIDKANFAWYPLFTQAYSITMTNSCVVDSLNISECATSITLTNVGVGNKPTTALLVSGLIMSQCFAGGTITDCVFNRVSLAASGAYTVTLSDLTGFTFTRCTFRANTIRGHSSTYNIYGTRLVNCTFTDHVSIEGSMYFITCNNITVTNPIHISAVSGTTVTTYTGCVVQLASFSSNVTINGLTLPVTNTHPYTALFQIDAAGCSNIKLRNVGTRISPITCGSSNASGYLLSIANGAAANGVKVQRCYVSQTRTGLWVSDNSSTNIIIENCSGDYADAPVNASLNMICRAIGCTPGTTAQTSVYGTHFIDSFISTTVGRIYLRFNEKTSVEPSASTYTITSGNPNFTSAGGLYMPTIGDQIEFTMPYYALGHNSFQNTAAVMAGGTIGNYSLEYKIDKNDGNGFTSSWTTLNGSNLSSIIGIDPSLGIKLKLRITTTTTNTTAITSLYIVTNTSATSQDYQYPLESIQNTLDFIDVKPNSEIVIFAAGTQTVINEIENTGTSWSHSYTWTGADSYVDIVIFNLQYQPIYYYNVPLTEEGSTIQLQQIFDRNYLNQ